MGGSSLTALSTDGAITAQTLVAWCELDLQLSHGNGCVMCLAPPGIAGCCGQQMAKLVNGLHLQGTGKLKLLCRSFNSYMMGGQIDTMARYGYEFLVPANYFPLQFSHARYKNHHIVRDEGSKRNIDIDQIRLLCVLFPEVSEPRGDRHQRHWDRWHWEDLICVLTPGTKVFVWSGRLDADLRGKLIELIPEVTFITHSADGVW
mmetsp:Transcript_104293/g.207128  ORF Transcript_104293/g.207128 Transcript_104293/m.207128 type:complete len:204 (-) Transcript_104293:327-938(-)